MSATNVTLGERIRLRRTALGLTLQQVGDNFGINRSSVSAWEAGTSRPDPDKLPKLAAILETTVGWLLQGGDVPLSAVIKTTTHSHLSYKQPPTTQYEDTWSEAPEQYAQLTRTTYRFPGNMPVLAWEDAGYWYRDLNNAPLEITGRERHRVLFGGAMFVSPTPPTSRTALRYSRLKGDIRTPLVTCPFRASTVAYALQIENMENHAPDNPFFSMLEGDYIAVDPRRQAEYNSIVVARIEGRDRATLRQYLLMGEDEKIVLLPIDPRQTESEIVLEERPDVQIIGAVAGMWREF